MCDITNIYYFCPEIAEPCGGVNNIHSHVFWLNDAGLNAFIVHENKDFRFKYFCKSVPVVGYEEIIIRKNDAVVFPEGFDLEELAKLSSYTCIYAQSLSGLFENNPPEKWRLFPPDAVICCSRAIQSTLFNMTGIQAKIIPNYVDGTIFKPAKKGSIVSYMPRKHPEQYNFVIRSAQSQGKYASLFRFISIEGRTLSETAKILAESAVFLNLGTIEGFGLPPLEAMSCGCLVTGFSNHGGGEYASKDNGLWSNQGDLRHAALRLEEACRLVTHQKARNTIAGGMITARRYSPIFSKATVVNYWRRCSLSVSNN